MLEGSLTISRAEIVDVGVSEGSSGDGVSANSDPGMSVKCCRLCTGIDWTYEATGPIMLKISKSIASVTVVSSSPT